jgi:hypothetical protein
MENSKERPAESAEFSGVDGTDGPAGRRCQLSVAGVRSVERT